MSGAALGLGLGLEPAHNFMAANNFATFRKVFNENSHKLGQREGLLMLFVLVLMLLLANTLHLLHLQL